MKMLIRIHMIAHDKMMGDAIHGASHDYSGAMHIGDGGCNSANDCKDAHGH